MRFAKQLLYGTVYLAIIVLIGFWIYNSNFKPAPTCFDNKQNQNETGIDCGGPCLACEIGTLSPIEATLVKYFQADNQTIISAEIKNPNPDWAADYFSYVINVYGKNGMVVKSIAKTSYIYAGETKYLVEPAEIDVKNAADVKISFSGEDWKPAKEFPMPSTQTRQIRTEISSGSSNVSASGFVANSNAYPLSKTVIVGFLFNKNGVQIGASKTELENLPAFEEKSFRINFPKNISLLTKTTSTQPINLSQADPDKTKVYVEAIR